MVWRWFLIKQQLIYITYVIISSSKTIFELLGYLPIENIQIINPFKYHRLFPRENNPYLFTSNQHVPLPYSVLLCVFNVIELIMTVYPTVICRKIVYALLPRISVTHLAKEWSKENSPSKQIFIDYKFTWHSLFNLKTIQFLFLNYTEHEGCTFMCLFTAYIHHFKSDRKSIILM